MRINYLTILDCVTIDHFELFAELFIQCMQMDNLHILVLDNLSSISMVIGFGHGVGILSLLSRAKAESEICDTFCH